MSDLAAMGMAHSSLELRELEIECQRRSDELMVNLALGPGFTAGYPELLPRALTHPEVRSEPYTCPWCSSTCHEPQRPSCGQCGGPWNE